MKVFSTLIKFSAVCGVVDQVCALKLRRNGESDPYKPRTFEKVVSFPDDNEVYLDFKDGASVPQWARIHGQNIKLIEERNEFGTFYRAEGYVYAPGEDIGETCIIKFFPGEPGAEDLLSLQKGLSVSPYSELVLENQWKDLTQKETSNLVEIQEWIQKPNNDNMDDNGKAISDADIWESIQAEKSAGKVERVSDAALNTGATSNESGELEHGEWLGEWPEWLDVTGDGEIGCGEKIGWIIVLVIIFLGLICLIFCPSGKAGEASQGNQE